MPSSRPLSPNQRRRLRRKQKAALWKRRGVALVVFCLLTGGLGIGLARLLRPSASVQAFAPADAPRLNVLLVGTEPDPARGTAKERAGNLHLVSVRADGAEAFVLSFPPETQAGARTLGERFEQGGAAALESGVEALLERPVHQRIALDANRARAAARALLPGSTRVFLQEPLRAPLPGGPVVRHEPGWQALDPVGLAAFGMSQPETGDPDALPRQQFVMASWHRAARAFGAPWRVQTAGDALAPLLDSPLPPARRTELLRLFAALDERAVAYALAPGSPAAADGTFRVRPAALEGLLAKLEAPPVQEPPAGAAAPSVEILYDDPDDARVMALAEALGRAGVTVVRTAHAPVLQAETRLIDRIRRPAREAWRYRPVQGALRPHARLVVDPTPSAYGAELTLELGKGFFE